MITVTLPQCLLDFWTVQMVAVKRVLPLLAAVYRAVTQNVSIQVDDGDAHLLPELLQGFAFHKSESLRIIDDCLRAACHQGEGCVQTPGEFFIY